jgi:hypothetical protein
LPEDTEVEAMGFNSHRLGLLLSVVLLAGAARAAKLGNSKITVLMNNEAQVAPAILLQAEQETARIFRLAGIEVAWVNCRMGAEPDECAQPLGSNQFMVHIVRSGVTRTKCVLGESFLGEDGTGKYTDVFLERIQWAHQEYDADVAQLLGRVSAHELGHLLLGTNAHSNVGIMKPQWNRESLRTIQLGVLMFTKQQSRLMKTRIMRNWQNGGVQRTSFDSALPAVSGASPLRRQGFLP